MSAQMPELVDAWRLVAAGSRLEARLPLSSMSRLRDVLADAEADDVVCSIEFGRDALQSPYAELRIAAALPLLCQRSLQRFVLPVETVQRLGLIRDEADEAGLLPDYEALLVPEDGMLSPATLVEDELILAVPLIPAAPGSDTVERDWPVSTEEETRVNPFAALADLKKDRNN
ncbi:YceD family protein [Luteimonas sp. FCS-9]|uniref:YceD family protein n=1 Tax=Luteimonas sp. FCS-9 TaxID=1547516 RepID=UPI00063EC6F4|nr:YceD family protein [Luteimonas sp. FCS-9]KLI99795.1 characterized ACR protein [Luteimonas sp. FCS-9]